MAARILLDTDILLALFARDLAARRYLLPAGEVFLPAPALGEIYLGACRCPQPADQLMQITNFLGATTVLACDGSTALAYGQIKNQLIGRGLRVPENDLWIAALAIQHNLTLVSRDEHYAAIDGLPLERW